MSFSKLFLITINAFKIGLIVTIADKIYNPFKMYISTYPPLKKSVDVNMYIVLALIIAMCNIYKLKQNLKQDPQAPYRSPE